MNRLDAASQGAAGARWASRLVVVVLCLMLVVKVALGPGQSGQVPFVEALFVLPLLYVVPATRSWWTARRWWLLAAHLGPVVTAAAVVDGLAIVALQLHHSRPSPEGSRPWAWPWTLALQARCCTACCRP